MRAFGVALVAVAVTAIAAASSSAAKPVRFKVTIEASRTTSWSYAATTQQCSTISVAIAGSGQESVQFRTRRPLIVTAAGLKDGARSAITGTSTRHGSLTETFTGSPCTLGNPPGGQGCFPVAALEYFMSIAPIACPTALTAPTGDCGTHSFQIRRGTGFYLGYGDGLSTGDLSVQLAVEQPLFRDCPGLGKAPRGLFIFAKLPYAKLLGQKSVVIRGSTDRFFDDVPGLGPDPALTGSTLGKWTLRFERMP